MEGGGGARPSCTCVRVGSGRWRPNSYIPRMAWLKELEKSRLPIFQRGNPRESPGLSTEHNMGAAEDNQVWWGGQGVGDPAQAVAVALVAIPPTPVS